MVSHDTIDAAFQRSWLSDISPSRRQGQPTRSHWIRWLGASPILLIEDSRYADKCDLCIKFTRAILRPAVNWQSASLMSDLQPSRCGSIVSSLWPVILQHCLDIATVHRGRLLNVVLSVGSAVVIRTFLALQISLIDVRTSDQLCYHNPQRSLAVCQWQPLHAELVYPQHRLISQQLSHCTLFWYGIVTT